MFQYIAIALLLLSCACPAEEADVFADPPVFEDPPIIAGSSGSKPRVIKKITYTEDDSADAPSEVYVEETLNGKKILVKKPASKADVYEKKIVDGKEVLVKASPAKKKRVKKTEIIIEEPAAVKVVERPVMYPHAFPRNEFGLGFGWGGWGYPWYGRHWW